MFILLLVELLKVGGVIVFTVRSHLLPHLSLLSGLRMERKKHNANGDHKHILAALVYTDTLKGVSRTQSVGHGIKTNVLTHLCVHACTCRHVNAERVQTRRHRCNTTSGTSHSLRGTAFTGSRLEQTHKETRGSLCRLP